MKLKEPALIEPGLLSLFRMFMWIQWLILILALLQLAESDDVGSHATILLILLSTSFLLLYLRSEHLERWLRRIYLPISIIIAGFTPVIARMLAVQVRLDAGITGNAVITDEGALILWLFVPLIAVATQYGFVLVVIFCLVTSGLEILIGASLANSFGIATNVLFEQLAIRNLVFLAIGFIISRLINEQRQQRASLRDANQQLAQYTVTLEQLTVSRERNRMARDLHDTLAHTLSAVSIQLEAVNTIWDASPDLAKQRIEKIQVITRDGLNETRQALQALRSSPLDDLGLTMALHVMALKASERAGFRLHFTVPDALPDLSPEIELNLYRIAEEAFNNAVQHAVATDLWFRLELEDEQLILQIRDNGIGYDSHANPPAGHFGLVGMQERANMCGASLNIESESNIGTLISLTLGFTT